MNWQAAVLEAPDLAGLARSEFERTGMALVGTLRRDGSPRISCVEPRVVDENLYLGMMWRSRKAVDLLRDSRLVLHNAIATNRGDEIEVILRGRAVERRDTDSRARYLDAVPAWGERRFHLFAVDLESLAVIRYHRGVQHVEVWPSGVRLQRPY